MSTQPGGPTFEPFYLEAAHGERLCIYYPSRGEPRSALIYVHPFGEEMNKARRVVAAQARMLADRGHAIFQMDLFGCGDSSGDFGDARWEIWQDDVALAVRWLDRRVPGIPIHLWGLRLGAMLAMEIAKDDRSRFAGLVLWEPVLSGEAFISQLLRMRVASSLMSNGSDVTMEKLRGELDRGASLEIGGYDLAPQLASAIVERKLVDLRPHPATTVHWMNVVPGPEPVLPHASRRVIAAWQADGAAVEAEAVIGEPFWSTVEFADASPLIERTARALAPVYA